MTRNTPKDIQGLYQKVRACRVCRDHPRYGPPLPQEPRPILRIGGKARICIASQAPGNKAHQVDKPFYDPSGDRLREWLGVSMDEFYDPDCFAIVPMGFCFPGYDSKGGDLPPRKECAEEWHPTIFERLPHIDLILAIGQYAQRYHLPRDSRKKTLTETVAAWPELLNSDRHPRVLPLPHPSWRNNQWLKKNDWFERDLLPELRHRVRALLSGQ